VVICLPHLCQSLRQCWRRRIGAGFFCISLSYLFSYIRSVCACLVMWFYLMNETSIALQKETRYIHVCDIKKVWRNTDKKSNTFYK
jgi:hypothetical protein